MNVPESLLKKVVCYMIGLNKPISLYSFDRALVDKFRYEPSPGFCLKELLDRGYIREADTAGQMPLFEVTEHGSALVEKEYSESVRALSIIDSLVGELKDEGFEITEQRISPPFCSFAFLNRIFRFSCDIGKSPARIRIFFPADLSDGIVESQISALELRNNSHQLKNDLRDALLMLRREKN